VSIKPGDVAESTQHLQKVVQRQGWHKISGAVTTSWKVAVFHLKQHNIIRCRVDQSRKKISHA